MKKSIAVTLLIIISCTFLLGCEKSNDSEPYKYIAISATPTTNTKMVKIGADNSIVDKKHSKIRAIALSAFMEEPQLKDGFIYQTAGVGENGPQGHALVQIDPKTLNVEQIPGIARASSFLVDGDAVYTVACNNPSRIAKTILDDSGKSKVAVEAELKGMITEIYQDGGHIYTAATEDTDINEEYITITQLDKDTLKAIDKFAFPYKDSFGNVVATDKYLYFNPIKTVNGVVRYDKQTKKCDTIELSFNFITSISIKNGYMYALSSGDYTEQNAKLSKIDLMSNKVVREKNLPYKCLAYYCGEDKFVTLDGANLHEIDLNTLEEVSTIEVAKKGETRYNSFIAYEQIELNENK